MYVLVYWENCNGIYFKLFLEFDFIFSSYKVLEDNLEDLVIICIKIVFFFV